MRDPRQWPEADSRDDTRRLALTATPDGGVTVAAVYDNHTGRAQVVLDEQQTAEFRHMAASIGSSLHRAARGLKTIHTAVIYTGRGRARISVHLVRNHAGQTLPEIFVCDEHAHNYSLRLAPATWSEIEDWLRGAVAQS